MTDITTTANSVRSFIISEFLQGEDSPDFTVTSELITTGILDSLAVLKLISYLESEFGFSINPSEVNEENLNSIQSLCRLVEAGK